MGQEGSVKKHDESILLNMLRDFTGTFNLFHSDFNRILPRGVGFSIHIAVDGEVEYIVAGGQGSIQHFKGRWDLEERGLRARVNPGSPAFRIHIAVPV